MLHNDQAKNIVRFLLIPLQFLITYLAYIMGFFFLAWGLYRLRHAHEGGGAMRILRLGLLARPVVVLRLLLPRLRARPPLPLRAELPEGGITTRILLEYYYITATLLLHYSYNTPI